MSYITFAVTAAMLLASSLANTSPYTAVIVSFTKGNYDPAIVGAAGGRIIEEFKNMEMLYAIVPPRAFASLLQDPAIEFVEHAGQFGVAPDAEIYAIKVSDQKGKGLFSGIVEGINWSIENDMDVVTMSITGSDGSKALKKAVESAYNEHGLVLVAAVGNGNGDVLYPAADDVAVGVGCGTKDNTLASLSGTRSQLERV